MTNENNFEADTKQGVYTERLLQKQTASWKRFLDVQAPYRWNLQRLKPGLTLDIGCGIGRNLINLKGKGVGIDHNEKSVQIARNRGIIAFTPTEFQDSSFNLSHHFDSLLLSHVAEHMTYQEVINLLGEYIYLLKPGGKLIIITPQEVGYKSDSTHVEFMNFPKLKKIVKNLGFKPIKEYSFPFPRLLGYFFIYNEFVTVSHKPHSLQKQTNE